MKFTFDKNWLEKNADRDDSFEIAAGSFSFDPLPLGEASADGPTAIPAFGRLVNLCRRKHGWTIEDLAATARIDLKEALRIEHETNYAPGPRTVYQLSTALGLPRERMLQLSGNTFVRDLGLGEQALRFAARSESVEKLNRQEHLALEEFVKYLNESK